MAAGAIPPTTLKALLRGFCPRCRMGRIFRGTMLWLSPMNERCSACGLKFEREPGYFLGAMYISYALAVPLLAGIMALVWWLTSLSWNWILLVSALLLLPCTPALALFARVLWIYFDRGMDPGG